MAAGASRQGRVSLQEFELKGVRDTGRKIGDGSYATVVELDFHGLKCVGKKLHGLLYNTATPMDRANLLVRFAEECTLLSHLHHPCIVQFLGVYFESDSQLPVMVMEYLHTTLSACIDKYGILPPEILYEIFQDVILGLRYLHEQSPSIIHRDLSANNVLLATNMSAKISDLGVAKILNLSPAQMGLMTQTQTPGTPCYMPPESMIARPKYTNKVDIFSYGVMMVHMLSGQWPIPSEAFRPDPNNSDLIVPVSEVDRREEYFQKIDLSHPLLGLIRKCLSNNPLSRPEAVDILGQVKAVISQLPPSLENRVELIQQIQGQGEDRVVTMLRKEIQTKSRENEAHVKELDSRKNEVESKCREVETLKREVDIQSHQIDSKQSEIDSKLKEIASQAAEIQSLKEENTQQRRENELLRQQLESQSIPYPKPVSIEPLQSHSKLQWSRCADLPVGMNTALAVMVGNKVYIGTGNRYVKDDYYHVYQYDPVKHDWITLPTCPVRFFGIGQFGGNLITVGGCIRETRVTNKLHVYRDGYQKWEEYLQPMPTARYLLAVVTTKSAIIACGGVLESKKNSAAVEVYISETGRWHTTDSLPIRCYQMTSVTIDDTCYLLGGIDNSDESSHVVFSAPLSSLVEKATGKVPALLRRPVWKTLRDTPQLFSSAASLSGRLLAVGGCDSDDNNFSDVHMYQPQTNSWVKMTSGDLPVAVSAAAVTQLPGNKLFICGGETPDELKAKQAFIGSIADI